MSAATLPTAPAAPSAGGEFASFAQLKAAHLTLLEQEENETELQEQTRSEKPGADFLMDVRIFMLRATATGRLLDDEKERAGAQTMLAYWATVLFRAAEEPPPSSLAALDEDFGFDLDESQCPYLGIETFTEEKAHLFFGRQKLIKQWSGAFASQRALLVLGPSGSGKTSLTQAGLLPALRTGLGAGWRFLPLITPGAQPLDALVAAFQPDDPAAWRRALQNRPERIVELAGAQPVLLTVNNFQDASLLGSEQSGPFLTALAALMRQEQPEHRLLLIAKLDFSAQARHWLEGENLAARCEIASVPPFEARELRAIITEPAERVGLKFDEGLVDTLVNDFRGEPAALALLQWTLFRLWRERSRNRITWDAWHRIGGGQRAVETTAESILQGADADPLDAQRTQQIFLQLIQPGPTRGELACKAVPLPELTDTVLAAERAAQLVSAFRHGPDGGLPDPRLAQKTFLRLSQLGLLQRERFRSILRPGTAHAAAGAARVGQLIERFVDAGLLRVKTSAGSSPTAEIAHEALVRKWPLLIGWLDDARNSLRERSAFLRRIALGCAASVAIAALLAFGIREWQRKREASGTLARMYEERAERATETGDPAGAFLWFARALEGDPAVGSEPLHRLQLGAAWRQLPRLKELLHDPELSRSALAPSGEFVVTAGRNGAILWPLSAAAPPERKAVISGRNVTWIAVHPDPRQPLFLTVAEPPAGSAAKGEVTVWNATTGQQEAKPIEIAWGAALKAWFSPDGSDRLLIVTESGGTGGSVAVWNFRTGRMESTPLEHALPVNWAAFSPDGKAVVTAAGTSQDGADGEARVWAWEENWPVELTPHRGPVQFAAFSGDGSQIVTGSGALDATLGAARVWSYASPAGESGPQASAATAPFMHAGTVRSARFSPDGQWIATASFDRTVRLWHLRTQKEVLALRHDGDVYDVAFSPDGRFLVSGSRDRQARVWEVATGRLVQPPLHHTETVSEVAFSRDGRSILTTSRHTARLWKAALEEPRVRELDVRASAVAVSADGQRLVTVGDGRREVHVFETSSGRKIAGVPVKHPAFGAVAALNATGDRLAVADAADSSGSAFLLRIFELSAGGSAPELLAQFPLEHEPTQVTFSPDGGRVCTVSRDAAGEPRDVALWEITGGQRLATSPGMQRAPVARSLFSPEGNYLLLLHRETGARRGEARLWSIGARTLSPNPTLLEHDERITTAAFSPQGERFLLTGGIDDNAHLWEITERRLASRGILQPAARLDRGAPGAAHTHTADLTGAAFSPNGHRAVTSSKDQTAILWDVRTRTPIATLRHRSVVEETVFSADGSLVLTATNEPKLRVWSADDGGLVAILHPPSEVLRDSLRADARGIFAVCQDLGRRIGSASARDAGTAKNRPASASFEAARTARITPLAWSLDPLKLPPERIAALGELVAARRLQGRDFEIALSGSLVETWSRERQRYLAMSRKEEGATAFHNTAAHVSEVTQQWYAATWHLSQILAQPDKGQNVGLLLRRAVAAEAASDWPGGLAQSIADREKAIELSRTDPARQRQLGGIFYKLGDTYVTLANRTRDKNDWAAAISALAAAVKAQPPGAKDINPLISLGETYAATRKFAPARDAFTEAIEINPTDFRARARLAVAQLLLGDAAGYRRLCETLRTEEPRAGWSGLAWRATLTPAFESDREFWARLVELQRKQVQVAPPGDYLQRNTLGAILYRAGQFPEALTQLDEARAALVARRVDAITQAYDHRIRAPVSLDHAGTALESSTAEGRPLDWVFLAMTQAQLGNIPEAERWMQKLREAPELAHLALPGSAQQPVPWSVLELEILMREAGEVLRRARSAPLP